MEEIARQAGWAKTFGLPLELISPPRRSELFPPMSTDGVLGAAFLPTDGYIDPSQLTFALAEGARRRGAEVSTNTRVTGIATERGRVAGVETDKGRSRRGRRQRGRDVRGRDRRARGRHVPIVPMAHEYLVLEPSGLPLDMPTMRDPRCSSTSAPSRAG
jgi:4-methylaminobutanoate oxidase (formaldehyde-forming)